MAEATSSTTPTVNFVNGKTPVRSNTSPYTHRPLGRASTFADVPSSLSKRRGSALSDTFDEARQSMRSSTEDLLLPRPKSPHVMSSSEHSYWHSAPLALALLPALGGLFFKNGSALVTDLTLLGLAGVFLHWSVTLPWDWYRSAQSQKPSSYPNVESSLSDDTIIEEGSENGDEKINFTHESEKSSASESAKPNSDKPIIKSSAASELRFHELTALFTCFISPTIGAWLLHNIRSQLSRPSEGLVSNYNLTIFLLAAELRPLAHVTKLVQARTLYLQRSIDPSTINGSISPDPQKLQDLSSRLDDLETHISSTSVPTSTTNAKNASSPTTPQITTEVRKSMQPDLDALNRAVRRYEKRATLLSMQTESRLQDLESRMADAITLAAAAERSIHAEKLSGKSSTLVLLDWVCATVVVPVQTIGICISFPVQVIRATITAVEGFVSRSFRNRTQKQNQHQYQNQKMSNGRSGARGSGGENGYVNGSMNGGINGNGNVNGSLNGNYERRSSAAAGKARGLKRV